MKRKFAGLAGTVIAGIRTVAAHNTFFSVLAFFLLGLRVVPAFSLSGVPRVRPNASQLNRLDYKDLSNLSLCFHIKQHPRVSSLRLGKLIRFGSTAGQSGQMFSTHIVNENTYRYVKIVQTIGQSVNYHKRYSINHWSHWRILGAIMHHRLIGLEVK